MRKIEDRADWIEFTFDAEDNINGACRFGLSQNGDDIEGVFDYETYSEADGYDDPVSVCRDVNGVYKTTREFIEGVEGNYSYPFYVCDMGANCEWL